MIYLFWATCRPLMMRKTYGIWMDRCVHPDNVRLKIVVDNSIDLGYLTDFDDVTVADNPEGGIVRPLNLLLDDFEGENNDVMIVPSDDFYPPTNWDMYLKETMEGSKGVLKVNDGSMADIISIPIMTYAAFVRMNRIIYHPAYNHMFCDKELHDTAHELDICRSVDRSHPVWEHKHPHFKTRELDKHDKRNNEKYAAGKEIYRKRRYMTLAERMKI